MHLLEKIRTEIVDYSNREFGQVADPGILSIGTTKKEFEGDITVVVFPLVKLLKKSPVDIGGLLGEHLTKAVSEVATFNVVQGFLNLTLHETFWKDFIHATHKKGGKYGDHDSVGEKVMIEYSSPNTNKPLHLGHLRNILLGWSSAKILGAAGFDVVKVQVINDRGIAICKSMTAWQLYADGATPASTSIKGDHFVGEYYVLFQKKLREEYHLWQASEAAQQIYAAEAKGDQSDTDFFKAYENQYFNKHSQLGAKARNMLQLWENGDPEVLALWKTMNGWVYEGFDETYANIGVSFDRLYYESETWKLGRQEVLSGVKKNKFFQKPDNSIWVDLTSAGMDEKILLRADGTSVYMTQDIGTAITRFSDYGIDRMVYVVGDEQNYHFKVLFEILQLLDQPYTDGLHHLSYGMVDLPTGKMKGREGTVVDADDLMAEVIETAKEVAVEKGELTDMTEDERVEVFRKIGLAALKFFILKVNPKKRMVFDPAASVDIHGQTGPYVQNAYVRIKSILRKSSQHAQVNAYESLHQLERNLAIAIFVYPGLVKRAAAEYDPSLVANYLYDLAKAFHRFYHDVPILNASDPGATDFRLTLSMVVANVLKHGMNLLGIEMPERM